MACLRCRVSPIAQDDRGQVTVYLPGSLDRSLMSESADLELEHARPSTGAFLARGVPPKGLGKPRICCLCSSIYYPRVS